MVETKVTATAPNGVKHRLSRRRFGTQTATKQTPHKLSSDYTRFVCESPSSAKDARTCTGHIRNSKSEGRKRDPSTARALPDIGVGEQSVDNPRPGRTQSISEFQGRWLQPGGWLILAESNRFRFLVASPLPAKAARNKPQRQTGVDKPENQQRANRHRV